MSSTVSNVVAPLAVNSIEAKPSSPSIKQQPRADSQTSAQQTPVTVIRSRSGRIIKPKPQKTKPKDDSNSQSLVENKATKQESILQLNSQMTALTAKHIAPKQQQNSNQKLRTDQYTTSVCVIAGC
jgi:hypothetical protein